MAATDHAVLTNHSVVGCDWTYQTYPLLTSVSKFSPTSGTWSLGAITTVKILLSDDGSIGLQIAYFIEYGDGQEEELNHAEVAERILQCPMVQEELGST